MAVYIFRWIPTDKLDISLIAAYTELDDDGWIRDFQSQAP